MVQLRIVYGSLMRVEMCDVYARLSEYAQKHQLRLI